MKPHYLRREDQTLADMLPFEAITTPGFNPEQLHLLPGLEHTIVHQPDDDFAFLHEAAIIEFHSTLFAAWYNCPSHELKGHTPIRARRSTDGGKTWSDPETLAQDDSGQLLYCPPVFAVVHDTLYLLMNTMTAPDHIHSLELHRYDERHRQFRLLWSRPIPFKLNTNLCVADDGTLFLPGRLAPRIDAFPDIPAILVADSQAPEGTWHAVPCTPSPYLPDRSRYIHPETSAIADSDSPTITLFCRDDQRNVPLLFHSHDRGASWSAPIAHNIPFSNSKIYAGTLPDQRRFLIGNLLPSPDFPGSRDRLAIYVSQPGSHLFSAGGLLQAGPNRSLNLFPQFSYPAATVTHDNRLLVLYTMVTTPDNQSRRGAILTSIPLDLLPNSCGSVR